MIYSGAINKPYAPLCSEKGAERVKCPPNCHLNELQKLTYTMSLSKEAVKVDKPCYNQ